MSEEYASARLIARLRLLARVFCWLVFLGVSLALTWRILAVSERRSMQATLTNLDTALVLLSAEHVAQVRALPPGLARDNPFRLLRWQQDDYCGELRDGQPAAEGCWYFLPQRAWLLYRSRFSDGASEAGDDLYLYRVRMVPRSGRNEAESPNGPLALELEPIAPAERPSATLWKD